MTWRNRIIYALVDRNILIGNRSGKNFATEPTKNWDFNLQFWRWQRPEGTRFAEVVGMADADCAERIRVLQWRKNRQKNK